MNGTAARDLPTANGYPYQPLPTPTSIRLLEFAPLEDDHLRVIRMHIVDLNDNPKYAALSYTWGDQSEPGICKCDGHDVRITANLAAFFRRFKGDGAVPELWYENSNLKMEPNSKSSVDSEYDYLFATKILPSVKRNLRQWPSIPASPRLLWVDSLCINQQDPAEVSQQISLMGQIYRKADLVNVWLSDEDPDATTSAMRAVVELIRCWHMNHTWTRHDTPIKFSSRSSSGQTRSPSISELLPHTGVRIPNSRQCRIAPHYTVHTFEPLFNKPWFMRAWTYQESQLASRKMFSLGSYNIPDTHMQAALCGFKDNYASKPNIHRGAEAMGQRAADMTDTPSRLACCPRFRLSRSELPTLLELLVVRRGAQSTLWSDSVYSLLGLAHDGSEVVPNYNLSWQEVFIQSVTRTPWLSSQAGLSRLFAECNDQVEVTGLPSWVPDWRVHYGFLPELPLTCHRPCTGSYKLTVHLSTCSRLLHLQGRIIDSVATVWHRRDFSVDIWGGVEYQQTAHLLTTVTNSKDDFTRFFDTSNGLFGKGLSRIQVGDDVAVIYGVCKPLILRKNPSGTYRFVGQCYLRLREREGEHVHERGPWLDVPEHMRNTITLE